MSGRVKDSRVSKPSQRSKKVEQRDSLLSSILQNAVNMRPCSFCESQGLESCEASVQDSNRCFECVRQQRSKCDVFELNNSKDLLHISAQHQKLEDEIEELEEKLMRLRKQKRMWREKMSRAIRRGLRNLDELDRVEKEEAEAERARIAEQSAEVARRSSTEEAGGMVAQEAWLRSEGEVGVFDWSSMANDVGDWSTFLDVPGVGGDAAVGGPSKS